ncbi:MAG: flippase-like domain-containing protein [Endomicrobia bacterium]|nr:flippase-like domain-containing protein [Endomicrobiia bacterium]MCL2798882.1 flippase-like domain-containing protein [Endomicrobiia bacterium]
MLKKHIFKILLGFLFSAVLIYLTLKQIDFKNSLELIKNADYYVLLLGVLIYAVTYVLRSVRYYFMILPIKKTKILENFPYTVLGFFMNNIIPLRLGELIRAKVTGERLGISRSSVLGTILIERLMDIIIFVLFFFLIMFVIPFPEFIKKSFYVCAVVFGTGLFVLFLISRNEGKALKIVSRFPMPSKIKNFVTELFNKFAHGLGALKNPAVFSIIFLMTVVIWVTESMFLVIVAYSCGIKISLLGGIFTVIIIGIGAIIPTAPGYIGAFEFMGITAMSVLSVSKDSAFACIAIYHFLQITVIFILGFGSIVKTKISFADLFKFAKIEEEKSGKEAQS